MERKLSKVITNNIPFQYHYIHAARHMQPSQEQNVAELCSKSVLVTIAD